MLSNSEQGVYDLVVQGLSNQQIAKQLFVCEQTVKFHITNIFKKTNVQSRAQLIAKHGGTVVNYQRESEPALPVSREQTRAEVASQQDKINFVDSKFKVGEAINHLHGMMKSVTEKDVNPATVNAACHCVAKINETIDTAIKAARFLNER